MTKPLNPSSRSRTKRTHSTVLKLPAEVQAAIQARLDAGDTYDAITEHLQAMGHDVSRSAVSRWGQQVTQRQERLAASADLAQRLTEKLGADQLEEAATLLALELVVNTLMQNEVIIVGDDGLFLPHVTSLISALARVSSVNLSRERWKADVERRAKDAAEAVAGIAKAGGLSHEAIELIKGRILGVATEGAT